MTTPLVLDASTAILLAKIGLLGDVARRSDLWMADVPLHEATVKGTDDALTIEKLCRDGRIRHRGVRLQPRLLADFRLHEGEAQTILLARELDGVTGTDDGPAIRCLKVLGLPFTTAVNLLVVMAETGATTIELAHELLTRLERFGRYDPRILEDAARRIRAAGGST